MVTSWWRSWHRPEHSPEPSGGERPELELVPDLKGQPRAVWRQRARGPENGVNAGQLQH